MRAVMLTLCDFIAPLQGLLDIMKELFQELEAGLASQNSSTHDMQQNLEAQVLGWRTQVRLPHPKYHEATVTILVCDRMCPGA